MTPPCAALLCALPTVLLCLTLTGAADAAALSGPVVSWGKDNFEGEDEATPPDDVNGVSGTATEIAAGSNHSLAIIALPEPSALTALGSGIAMLGLLYRRRRYSLAR